MALPPVATSTAAAAASALTAEDEEELHRRSKRRRRFNYPWVHTPSDTKGHQGSKPPTHMLQPGLLPGRLGGIHLC